MLYYHSTLTYLESLRGGTTKQSHEMSGNVACVVLRLLRAYLPSQILPRNDAKGGGNYANE